MIKPSTATPASLVATRAAAPAEDDARADGREEGDAAFTQVMDAQAPRDGAAAASEPARREEAAEAPKAETPEPEVAPSADPMLALCLPQPVEAAGAAGTAAIANCTTGMAGLEGVTTAAVVAEGAAAEPTGALRATLEGLIQPRFAPGNDATAVVAELGRDAKTDAAGDDVTPATPSGANPAAGVAESRPRNRATGPEAAQAPARPPELRAPLGSGAWTDELGAHVTWMVDRGDQFASLRLSPENLGPLEVRIAVREGETSVWFGAAQPETRAALEQSLPRLREMLGASGLSLADAGVFSHTPRDPQRGFTTAALARASQESGVESASGIVMQVSRRGLVDLYA